MGWTVKKMSLYGVRLLTANPSGVVHSVYRNTINLTFGNRILSLHPKCVPMSPISLITNIPTNCFGRLGIEEGTRVTVDPDSATLSLAELERPLLSYAQAAIVDLRPPGPLPEQRILFLLQNLRNSIPKWESEGLCTVFLPSQQAPNVTVAALRRITQAKRYLATEQWEDAAESLCSLIGLGPGLTPSGDDFLCGMLAGVELVGLAGHPFVQLLKEQVLARLSQTNDISCAFLQCALEGQYGEVIQLLYTESIQTILAGMRQIGHTSGVDTLCGILYLFQIWKEFCSKNAMVASSNRFVNEEVVSRSKS